MTTHEFNNDSNQAERQRVERDTYLSRAQADADLAAQGRFKRETATRITGVPEYPKQPANSPWRNDPVPASEPLGFSVNNQEPVGTPTEVEQSIRALKDGAELPLSADDGSMAPSSAWLDVEPGPNSPSSSSASSSEHGEEGVFHSMKRKW